MSAPRDTREFMFDVDIVKYGQVLVAQRAFIAVFCGAAILTSLALTYVFSEMYASATTIHYRPGEVSLLRQRSTEALGAPLPSIPFKVISQTLADVMKSEAILRPVVEQLHLDVEVKPTYDSWYRRWFYETKRWVKGVGQDAWQLLKYGRFVEDAPADKAVKGLAESLSLASTKDSYIFVLAVKDQYPERAAMIVDAVAAQLVRWSREQVQSPAQVRSERLSTEYSGKEQELARLRRERDAVLREGRIVSLNDEVNTGVQGFYNLRLDLERAEAQVSEKRRRFDELGRTISGRKDRYVDPDQLKRLQEERTLAEIDVRALEAKRDTVRESVERLQRRLQEVLEIRKRYDDISARIDAISRENVHLSDMQLESSEARTSEGEVSVLNPASVSTVPVQPIKIYHVGLTALLSLLFSAGLVYVFTYFNIRVFFPSRPPGAGAASADHGRSADASA